MHTTVPIPPAPPVLLRQSLRTTTSAASSNPLQPAAGSRRRPPDMHTRPPAARSVTAPCSRGPCCLRQCSEAVLGVEKNQPLCSKRLSRSSWKSDMLCVTCGRGSSEHAQQPQQAWWCRCSSCSRHSEQVIWLHLHRRPIGNPHRDRNIIHLHLVHHWPHQPPSTPKHERRCAARRSSPRSAMGLKTRHQPRRRA